MTRKDYVKVAQAIREMGEHNAVDLTWSEGWHAARSSFAQRMAGIFQTDNARFDRARFFEACGLPGAK